MTVILPRVVQLNVGPPGGVGRSWSELYIKFEVERTGSRTANKCKVEVYNLSPASLVFLEQPGHVVQLLAGEGVPTTLFYGELRKGGVETEVKHPNQVTTIKATDGQRILQSGIFSGSYPAGSTRSQILTDVLAAGVIARGYIAPLPERTYQAPVAFSAPTPDVLDELFAGELATWSLQSERFTLLADGQAAPGNAPIISAATGMIGSPKRKDKGVKVSTSQMGAVAPGGGFVIASRLLNGQYRASKVLDKGDTEGQGWQSDLVGVQLS